TRFAAMLLALLGVIAMAPFSFESILEQVAILGIAIFLYIAGPGSISLDARRSAHGALAHEHASAAAFNLLRVAMGFGIAYNALTEKLLNPDLSQALLDQLPFLNVLRPLGFADPVFIWLAGRAHHQTEVPERDIEVLAEDEQVDDDEEQPGRDDIGREPWNDRDEQTGDDLDDADALHEYRRRHADRLWKDRREVLRPVGQQRGELVEAEKA